MPQSIKINGTANEMLRGLPSKGPVGWRILKPLLERFLKALSWTFSVDGGDLQQIVGGLHLRIHSASGPAPWSVYQGASSSQRRIRPGTIGDVMPVIGGVRLDHDTAPDLTITPSAINYIYVRCTFTVDRQDAFVTGGDLVQGNAEVIASTTELTGNGSSDIHYLHIATINSAGVATPMRTASVDFVISDTGAGNDESQVSFFA